MERRIIQNTNDILSIYDMLSVIQTTQAKHTIQLANLTAKVDSHDGRFDAVDARFDAVDARFETVDARSDAIDARFEAVDARFDRIDVNIAEVLRRLP